MKWEFLVMLTWEKAILLSQKQLIGKIPLEDNE